jgi:hypothetical protein
MIGRQQVRPFGIGGLLFGWGWVSEGELAVGVAAGFDHGRP